MAVGLGINNLITCHITTGKSYIISCRQLLSIYRYFDKKTGYYQYIVYAKQSAMENKYQRKRSVLNNSSGYGHPNDVQMGFFKVFHLEPEARHLNDNVRNSQKV